MQKTKTRHAPHDQQEHRGRRSLRPALRLLVALILAMGLMPAIPAFADDPPPTGPSASLSIAGPTTAVTDEPFDVTVSLADSEQSATLKLTFELSEGVVFAGSTPAASVQALQGFELIDVYNRPGTRMWGITIGLLNNPAGVTVTNATEIVKLSLSYANAGTASVKLTHAELARYTGSSSADVPVTLPSGASSTVTVTVEEPPTWLTYDFNRDGKESLADLAFAQLYYQASAQDGGPAWDTVVERGMDLNADGKLDILDFVLILSYLYGR